MWPYPWTHVGTPSHLGHMDRVAATMPSQAHAGAAQEAPNIGQWEGQDVPLVRPSSCTVKGGFPSSRRYLPTYLLSRRAIPHLHPSRIELAIASWDTLDTPPEQHAIHILKADAQWWVLHWAQGVLMAAQAYTPEIDPEDPPQGRQRLLHATIFTGREGAPWEALHTALYWAQGSPNGPDTPGPKEAWVMQAKAMRNYHLHHPFDDSPAALPWPSDPLQTVHKLADLMRSHAQANMQTPAEPPLRDPGQQATHPLFKPHAPAAPLPPVPPKRVRRKRGAPAPNQAGKAATSRPPAPHPTHPANPDQASSSSSLPSLPPPQLDQASSSSSLPAPAPPPPEAYPGFQKGAKVQQPFRNDHTGDLIWCEGTIQYRLRDPGGQRGATDPVGLAPPKGARPRQQRPGQARGPHPGAHQRPPHPTPYQREQGPQRHQIHWGAPPGVEPRPPPPAPTQAPTNRQKVSEPSSPSLTGQGLRAQASTAPARPHRGHRRPPRPQPPGRHILEGRHNRPPGAPDGTGARVGSPPPRLPGTRPTRRPPRNHPHIYPGPESEQMLLAQGDPPIRPNRHPRPPRPPPQRPREVRCL